MIAGSAYHGSFAADKEKRIIIVRKYITLQNMNFCGKFKDSKSKQYLPKCRLFSLKNTRICAINENIHGKNAAKNAATIKYHGAG